MKNGITVFAAIAGLSLAAAPFVMGSGNAFATAEDKSAVGQPVAVVPVEVAAVVAPAAEACARKVRVVYSGYGTPPAACLR